jgi:hypothetical protein
MHHAEEQSEEFVMFQVNSDAIPVALCSPPLLLILQAKMAKTDCSHASSPSKTP